MYTRPYELYISLDHLQDFWKCKTDWQNELPLRAISVALELSFLLIYETGQDLRPTLCSEERINRLITGCCQQIELLGEILDSSAIAIDILSNEQSSQTNSKVLTDLDRETLKKLEKWSFFYTLTLEKFPFALGIEQYIELLQSKDILINTKKTKPTIPYDEWINPIAIANIFNLRNFNQEDKIFAAVHQITECWLVVALDCLKRSRLKAQKNNWQAAAAEAKKVCSIINYLAEHILLLETMVLADYHPLRVGLRDASGAQSKQALELVTLAKALFLPITEYLNESKCCLLDIHHTPTKHTQVYQYIEVLLSLELRLNKFFFCHYKLATRILGIESLGSLGFEVQALIKRFTNPLYLDLDEVRYQYVVITNFKYGQYAGNLISSLEPKSSEKLIDEPVEVPGDIIREQVARYIKAIVEHDIDGWVALFETDASIEDPYGSREFRNHSGLEVFFRSFIKIFASRIEMKSKEILIFPRQGKAEFNWEIQATHKDVPVDFSGREEIQFAKNGKIKRVRVFHDTSAISQQLLAAFTEKASNHARFRATTVTD